MKDATYDLFGLKNPGGLIVPGPQKSDSNPTYGCINNERPPWYWNPDENSPTKNDFSIVIQAEQRVTDIPKEPF